MIGCIENIIKYKNTVFSYFICNLLPVENFTFIGQKTPISVCLRGRYWSYWKYYNLGFISNFSALYCSLPIGGILFLT